MYPNPGKSGVGRQFSSATGNQGVEHMGCVDCDGMLTRHALGTGHLF